MKMLYFARTMCSDGYDPLGLISKNTDPAATEQLGDEALTELIRTLQEKEDR